jgi:hypothetical protein
VEAQRPSRRQRLESLDQQCALRNRLLQTAPAWPSRTWLSPDRIRDGANGADPVSRVEPTQSARGLRREPAAYQALKSLATHKTDRNDARGLAHLARTGFFKPVHVKSLQAHALRSLIIARQKLVASGSPWKTRSEASRSCSGSGSLAPSPPPSSRYQSGEVDYVGGISKCGDRRVRTLLYEAANVMLTRYKGQLKLKDWAALSHLAFLLLITTLTAGLGFNRFNGLGSRWDVAIEPLLARCDNAPSTVPRSTAPECTREPASLPR